MKKCNRWFDLAMLSELRGCKPVAMAVEGRQIGVFEVNDKLYAVENICPHADALLSEGFVSGEVVECHFHNARFHIPSGKCLRRPGRDLETYPLRICEDQVMIQLESRDV